MWTFPDVDDIWTPTTISSPTTKTGNEHVGLVRMGPLVAIPAILQKLGHDPGGVAASAGFELSRFDDPDTVVSYVAASRLLDRCVAVTQCEHFGLLIGEAADPSHLGIAGYLIRAAQDVGTALQNLLEYLDLHDRGGVPTLRISSDSTRLGYAIHQSGAEAIDQIYDLSIAMACNIMRAVCGNGWAPSKVLLSRHRPDNETPYRHFFHAPLHFEAKESAVVFSTHWLSHPVPTSDPLLFGYLSEKAQELHAQLHVDLAGEMQPLLHQCLKNQQCCAATVAKQLGIHERTLNRRLHAEGTSFRQELEHARKTLSQQLLSATDASMTEIALSLGYSDASAFSRAFKRWSGTTPAKWRDSLR